MKKLIFICTIFFSSIKIACGQATDLNRVTVGFSAGYSHNLDNTYDYSLTTDANHYLKLQALNKNAFVVSSVFTVKLGKIAADDGSDQLIKHSQKVAYNSRIRFLKQKNDSLSDKLAITKKDKALGKNLSSQIDQNKASMQAIADSSKANFSDRLSLNVALDLANVNSNVTFNKKVSGGIGLGYFLTSDVQIAVFYDISSISQLRDYIVNNYQDKAIPNGSGTVYNSLSTSDNSLFYNKTISGFSLKLIFSLANKKADTSQNN
jgi:hypothetical protein